MKSHVCPINFHGLAVARVFASILEMSRRSRRRGNAGGAGWLGKAAIGLIVAGLVGAGVLYAMVRSYLHSDAFRRFLSGEVSEAAGVHGEFTPFRWDGLAVDTSAFDATGKGIIKGLRVEGLHTEVGVSGVSRSVWEIQGSRVQRLEVSLDARESGRQAAPPVEKKVSRQPASKKGWLPTKVELQGVDVREVVVRAQLDQGPAEVDGMRVRVEAAGGKNAYRIEAADGTIRLPFRLLPEIRLNRAKLRWQDGQVFLNSATASAWNDGRFEGSGEYDVATGRYSLEGDVTGVKCENVFSEDWAKRFIGDMNSDFTLGNPSGSLEARGRLEVLNGTLTALPALDALAAYADTRRFRVLSLSEARTDWNWKKGEIFLSDLVMASEGLARLEGSIFIRGRELDGTFRLGLAAGTLATIPGAETDVFSPGERGLVWAPLRITGTLDDPKEDLTDRLVAAAGLRMFDVIPETGEKVIRFSRSLLGDTPANTLDRGAQIIKETSGIVEGVGGVIDGFFGKARKEEPKPEPEKPQR
jgi:hypothetical protein